MSDTNIIEVPIKLRITRCETCGLTFAIDAVAYIEAMKDKIALTCPLGHKPAVTWGEADSLDSAAVNLRLLAELRQSHVEVNRLHRELLSRPAPSPGDIDDKEIKRRAGIIANRAERAPYGRPLCRFCGKPKNETGLTKHLRQVHRDAIVEMAADVFS